MDPAETRPEFSKPVPLLSTSAETWNNTQEMPDHPEQREPAWPSEDQLPQTRGLVLSTPLGWEEPGP